MFPNESSKLFAQIENRTNTCFVFFSICYLFLLIYFQAERDEAVNAIVDKLRLDTDSDLECFVG